MKVWTPLFNFIAAFVMILLCAVYVNESRVISRDFDQLRLNYAVEQATEAMFVSTLQAEHLDMDYTDMAYAVINSSDALEIFDRVICFNYDMSPSQENFDMINNCIECCVLAGYDGFYITDNFDADLIPNNGIVNDGFRMKFSPKIPYYLYNQSGDTVYNINVYKKTYSGMSTTNPNAKPIMYIDGKSLPSGITEDDVNLAVNSQIRSAIISNIKNNANSTLDDLDGFRLYFPEDTTATGVNPFEIPGIIIILGQADFASTIPISAMSVSGYKVIRKVDVVTFTDTSTGRSYYCYDSQLQDAEKAAASGGIPAGGGYGNFVIENYYSSIQEACEAVSPTTGEHYAPYYDIIVRKITKYDG